MMSDCSSMRMQSTSCCRNSGCDVTSAGCFKSTAAMTCSLGALLPVYLAADLAAPELPGAHAGGLVNCVRQPALLFVERGHRTAPERRGPVLDAGIDLGIDGAKYRSLQRRSAGHGSVRAHEHDVLVAHDLRERHALGRIADQHVGGAELVADVEH